MGLQLFIKCGFKMSDLVEVDHGMCAANKVPIKILGAIILRLKGKSKQGEVYECAVMAFVSPDTDDFFLSKEAMQQLAIIPKDFPNVGAADVTAESATILTQPLQLPPSKPLIATTTETHEPAKDKCQCLKRIKPPGRPLKLPFPPVPENNLKFERWLKERYASSTFNQCPHQLLPEVVGPKIPPLAIHVEEDAVPVVHHKPGFIPLHHFDQVIKI